MRHRSLHTTLLARLSSRSFLLDGKSFYSTRASQDALDVSSSFGAAAGAKKKRTSRKGNRRLPVAHRRRPNNRHKASSGAGRLPVPMFACPLVCVRPGTAPATRGTGSGKKIIRGTGSEGHGERTGGPIVVPVCRHRRARCPCTHPRKTRTGVSRLSSRLPVTVFRLPAHGLRPA